MSSNKCQYLVPLVILLILISPSQASREITFSNSVSQNSAEARNYWPTEGWLSSTPEEQGMDSTVLDDMMSIIEDEHYAIRSVMIVRHGYTVLEEYPSPSYDENDTHLLYSVTKSFTSALVGIALDEGLIEDINQTMMSFFPDFDFNETDEKRTRITLEHLLTMRSGMFWDETSAPFSSPDNGIYHINQGDGINYCLNLPMVAEPGTLWHYNTGASHILSGIVQEVSGMTSLEYAEENLFEPLGIDTFYWSTDRMGVNKGGFDLRLTTRSMAKFGWLVLNNGTWDDQQVIAKDYVQTATSTITELDHGGGYGYQFWTLPELGISYCAGLYGQFIFVCPEYDLVVAFTSNMNDAPHFQLLEDYILESMEPDNNELAIDPITLGIVTIASVGTVVVIVGLVLRHRRNVT